MRNKTKSLVCEFSSSLLKMKGTNSHPISLAKPFENPNHDTQKKRKKKEGKIQRTTTSKTPNLKYTYKVSWSPHLPCET